MPRAEDVGQNGDGQSRVTRVGSQTDPARLAAGSREASASRPRRRHEYPCRTSVIDVAGNEPGYRVSH